MFIENTCKSVDKSLIVSTYQQDIHSLFTIMTTILSLFSKFLYIISTNKKIINIYFYFLWIGCGNVTFSFVKLVDVYSLKSDLFDLTNEKCITRDLGLANWKFLELEDLRIHIRSLRSAKWIRGHSSSLTNFTICSDASLR